ncbi:LOW QUALITY PROTEIN: hypothetical protein BC937DRAFT_92920 [Endogone sp. FLAS-F59071]|nr:LOW QUALITY PROTEIN: hypothetical protein BC937DRAFT_92920 [Endogone sp. FLAS-F59071]|eukprot:RUS15082.1 LOW QUALITY PROTEIN: hypothetical protein BC937DRAFT_92920 [Endogone sp. FLAS-F59071]
MGVLLQTNRNFLIFDGCGTTAEDRILIVGRRFRKRLYICLPEHEARYGIICNLLQKVKHSLIGENIQEICRKTEGRNLYILFTEMWVANRALCLYCLLTGYSGSDMDGLCRGACIPIREISAADIKIIAAKDVRPISFTDFLHALTQVRASVSSKDLDLYNMFNAEYGSLS